MDDFNSVQGLTHRQRRILRLLIDEDPVFVQRLRRDRRTRHLADQLWRAYHLEMAQRRAEGTSATYHGSFQRAGLRRRVVRGWMLVAVRWLRDRWRSRQRSAPSSPPPGT